MSEGFKVQPGIYSRSEQSDDLLDFLLWYLLVPHLNENITVDLTFLLTV